MFRSACIEKYLRTFPFGLLRKCTEDALLFSCAKENTSTIIRTTSSSVTDVQTGLDALSQAIGYSSLNSTPSNWKDYFTTLITNGFSVDDCVKMATLYPAILKMKPEDLTFSLKCWRNANMENEFVIKLLRSIPQFFLVCEKDIGNRISFLKSIGTSSEVVNLLRGAPNIMFEKWSDTEAKVSFIEDTMCINRKHIIRSYSLNRKLTFLKTRYTFLQRCGKYTKPKLKLLDENKPSRNPPLSKITDTNDEHFATLIAGVSLEEYEVFQELYLLELKDEDSPSDSE